MHHAPPVIYPVGRCLVCQQVFYIVWCLQACVLAGAAYASQPGNGQRWPWLLAAGMWSAWLGWHWYKSQQAAQSEITLPNHRNHPADATHYLSWQAPAGTGLWQLQTQAYSEPTAVRAPQMVIDLGMCVLVRVQAVIDSASLFNRANIQWLWLFERDSPARWLALRRALLAAKS
jgi:hypothetical protein